MNKTLLLYPLLLICFGLGIYAAVQQGRKLEAPRSTAESEAAAAALAPALGAGPSASLLANLRQNFQDPLTRLFVQLILIVLAARICGMVARKAGQPAVIGEMVAGILLGPSLLGWCWPGFFNLVFPPASLGPLLSLSDHLRARHALRTKLI